VLLLTEKEQEFVFTEVSEKPVPSLLRDFSAPVKLEVQLWLCAAVLFGIYWQCQIESGGALMISNAGLWQVEGQTEDELVFLLAHDKDAFCRWEAGQRLLRSLLTSLYTSASASKVSACGLQGSECMTAPQCTNLTC
jgi:aminopeptidase N